MKSQSYKQRRAANQFWMQWLRITTICNAVGIVVLFYLIATVMGCK